MNVNFLLSGFVPLPGTSEGPSKTHFFSNIHSTLAKDRRRNEINSRFFLYKIVAIQRFRS